MHSHPFNTARALFKTWYVLSMFFRETDRETWEIQNNFAFCKDFLVCFAHTLHTHTKKKCWREKKFDIISINYDGEWSCIGKFFIVICWNDFEFYQALNMNGIFVLPSSTRIQFQKISTYQVWFCITISRNIVVGYRCIQLFLSTPGFFS